MLDIERDPAEQGFAEHSFDVVVAANVIHATADLVTSLEHVRKLLAPGGMLVLLELTRPTIELDVTFGLTDGWWRFTDRDVRPDHPILGAGAWPELFLRAGFDRRRDDPRHVSRRRVDDGRAGRPRARGRRRLRRTTGSWLVLADGGGVGARLAERLGDCTLVYEDSEVAGARTA